MPILRLNKFQQYAAGRGRVDENVGVAARALARRVLSIPRAEAARRATAAFRSGTRRATWCSPGPRFSRNFAMGESGAEGSSSSMRESPAGSIAICTFSAAMAA